MPVQVIMPKLGESVVEGTVGRWLIAEGQPVKEYEPLLTVTTDKVDTEIPAPASGILLKILVPEGQTVPAETPLALIGESLSSTRLAQRVAAEHDVDLAAVPGTGPGGRITKRDVEAFLAETEDEIEPPQSRSPGFISPAVARLSAELGVDLDQVVGTGAGGRITKKDILAYVAAPVPRHLPPAPAGEPPPWERPGTGDLFKPTEEGPAAASEVAEETVPGGSQLVPLSAVRRSIARHMAQSKQTSPHATTVMEADMTRVVRAREALQGQLAAQGVRLTFTPFFVQAIVAGLKAVPEANSSFTEKGLLVHRHIHVGMAVAIPEGLIVPVIRHADEKSLQGLARAVNDLAERARTRRLAPQEVHGGTFTLTNHGTSGSLFATPIINQPQAGILGVGAIRKRPIVVSAGHPLLPDAGDALAIRPMVYLSFTFDHRVLDGQEADEFLAAVKRFLEDYGG